MIDKDLHLNYKETIENPELAWVHLKRCYESETGLKRENERLKNQVTSLFGEKGKLDYEGKTARRELSDARETIRDLREQVITLLKGGSIQ